MLKHACRKESGHPNIELEFTNLGSVSYHLKSLKKKYPLALVA